MRTVTTGAPSLGYADLPRLMTLMTGDEKHEPSATSTLDVLWVLYDQVLRVSPETAAAPDRDRFVLSKGHGPIAYYAVLAAKGFVDVATLGTFGRAGSRLGHHPDARLIPGVEIGSGSLGHGLGIAVGMVLGLRLRHHQARVYCLVGDAELEEGSNWEAIQFAGRRSLGALTAVVVDNRSSSLDWPGGIASRFKLEGWTTTTCDGRSHEALARGLGAQSGRAAHVLVAQVEPK